MIRFLRILGVMLIVIGAIAILSWFIEPLREAWPFVWKWFQRLPIAIQVGLSIAVVGFLMLFSSVVWERMEDRKQEGDLREE